MWASDNSIELQQKIVNIKISLPDVTLIYAENKPKDGITHLS